MAQAQPFRALRYAPSLRGDLTRKLSLSAEPAATVTGELDPLHVHHLLGAADPRGLARQWQREGRLVEDPAPGLYLVELSSRGATSRLLLTAVQPDPAMAPLETDAQAPSLPPLEPVLTLAVDDHQVLRSRLAALARQAPAEWEGRMVGHEIRLWRLASGGPTRQLLSLLEETTLRPLSAVPPVPYLAAIVPLSDPGLTFEPIHRGIRGLEAFHPDRFLRLASDYARILDLERSLFEEQGLAQARERLASVPAGFHAVLLVLPSGQGKILRFRQALDLTHLKAAPRSPTLRSLDLALLHALVLQTVLGIPEPDRAGHPQVFPVSDVVDLVDQVRAGVFQVGFALNPPPLWEVRAVIEAGQQLPPHTVRVEPKAPVGLLFFNG